MKIEKAVVDYRKEALPYEYRLTVYIGLEVDSGPSYQVLLTSVQDLYVIFNTYEISESYRMAEFCLNNGFNVLAQRINEISGKSSCRKFIPDNSGGRSLFFSPREEVDYSEPKEVLTGAGYDSSQGEINPLYSEIIRFRKIENSDNIEINDNFVLIVPKLTITAPPDENQVFLKYGFLGKNVSLDQFDLDYVVKLNVNNELEVVDPLDPFQAYSLTYKDLESKVVDFLHNICGFNIELREDNQYVYVYSNSMIQDFDYRNFTISNVNYQLLTITPSNIGERDNNCYAWNDYKVCTIYSKYEDSLDDISVNITKSDGYYYVTVYKKNSSGAVIFTENFNYSVDPKLPDFLNNLSRDSEVVDIEIYNEEADLSGVYELLGRTNLKLETDYIDSVKQAESEDEKTYNADICLDLSVDYQQEYIECLLKLFPNSLIFTSANISEDKVVSVNPNIIWNDTKYELRGFSYLLYMLKENSNISDISLIRLANSYTDYSDYTSFMIQENDYEVMLMGVYSQVVNKGNNLPIRTVVSVLAIENYILTSQHTSVEEFRESVTLAERYVNSYMRTNTQVQIVDMSIFGSRLTATLNFYVNNIIVSSYRIVATILE